TLIAYVRHPVAIPEVAKVDVWRVDDARRCLAESGCSALMLGRGMVAQPGLARAILGQRTPDWETLLPLMQGFWERIGRRVAARHRAGRLKQWLNLLRRAHPEAEVAFQRIRGTQDPAQVTALLWPQGTSPSLS
ncbi:MAG: tRNA-dihydrouridine synthase, partial [Rubrivivax sp.]